MIQKNYIDDLDIRIFFKFSSDFLELRYSNTLQIR